MFEFNLSVAYKIASFIICNKWDLSIKSKMGPIKSMPTHHKNKLYFIAYFE